MITVRFRQTALLLLIAYLGVVCSAVAGEGGMPFQATLIWGTDDAKPSDPKLKPVPPAVAEKLGKLPFKWKYYYAVECKEFSVDRGQRKKVRMSDECEIVVKAIDSEEVELALHGKGQLVGKVTQRLPKGHMLVTGGNAENLTAWFVVLRRQE